MFLVEDTRHGVTNLVFTWEDPRKAGYKGKVTEGVDLDYDMERVHTWRDGEDQPEVCVGQNPDNPCQYKVFRHRSELLSAGYHAVAGTPLRFGSWRDYVQLQLIPPDPDQTGEEPWYDYLDRLDEVSRQRRRQVQAPAPPAGGSREQVAEWVAKKHLFTDSSIREVWYLPQGAPPDEIRLLELNDRIAGSESLAEAVDFGLDVEGAQFRLFVADVTTDQLDKIKQDIARLPPGWSLAARRIWRRGA